MSFETGTLYISDHPQFGILKLPLLAKKEKAILVAEEEAANLCHVLGIATIGICKESLHLSKRANCISKTNELLHNSPLWRIFPSQPAYSGDDVVNQICQALNVNENIIICPTGSSERGTWRIGIGKVIHNLKSSKPDTNLVYVACGKNLTKNPETRSVGTVNDIFNKLPPTTSFREITLFLQNYYDSTFPRREK